jgi:hypothetical protein
LAPDAEQYVTIEEVREFAAPPVEQRVVRIAQLHGQLEFSSRGLRVSKPRWLGHFSRRGFRDRPARIDWAQWRARQNASLHAAWLAACERTHEAT